MYVFVDDGKQGPAVSVIRGVNIVRQSNNEAFFFKSFDAKCPLTDTCEFSVMCRPCNSGNTVPVVLEWRAGDAGFFTYSLATSGPFADCKIDAVEGNGVTYDNFVYSR